MCLLTSFPSRRFVGEVSATFSPSLTLLFKLTTPTSLDNRGRKALPKRSFISSDKGGILHLGGKFINWLLSVISHHMHMISLWWLMTSSPIWNQSHSINSLAINEANLFQMNEEIS